jgi:hypothetical protein
MSIPGEHIPQILLFSHLADVGNTQRSAIIAIELAAHLFTSTNASTQMWGNVASRAGTQAATRSCTTGRIVWHIGRRDVALGSHGVFEGTFCGEMVALANTTLDLRVLELSLLLSVVALLLVARLPVADRPEDDVLGDGDGICLRARGLALLLPEFRPLLALGYAGVDDLLDDGFLDAACDLVLFAVFRLDYVRGYGFAAVFVLGDLWLGEGCGRLLVVFFRPVGAAIVASVCYLSAAIPSLPCRS